MQIEDIIKNRRDDLNVEDPPAELWKGIRDQWKQEPKKSNFNWWKVAAAVLLVSTFSLLYYNITLQQQVEKLASLGDISEEYAEVEKGYLSEIALLEASINLSEFDEKDDFAWITDEMKVLEEINELYRKDIGKVPDQEQLIEALIDYYEKKIKLLKTLELEINRTQKFKEDEKRTTDNISI